LLRPAKRLISIPGKIYACTYMLVVICSIKLALVALPFKTFRSVYSAAIKTIPAFSGRDDKSIAQAVRIIQRSGSILPFRVLCLTQALALKFFLRKENDYLLKIGVQLNEQKKFHAHAWIEHNGDTVIGDLADSGFTELWVWNA
jgi:hypothetical protein